MSSAEKKAVGCSEERKARPRKAEASARDSRRVKARKIVGKYALGETIGFGSFAKVFVGRHVDTGLRVAVKAINLRRVRLNPAHIKNLRKEIAILRQCKHRNVVTLLTTYQTLNHIYLVLQFCGGGDLHTFVAKRGALREAVAQRFAYQLAEGLRYLHSFHIIHRDLKPQNVLLSARSDSATLKIADFGFARHFSSDRMVDTMCGSPLYMAPEILKYSKYSSKVDLWSAGTILYQTLTGRPPFHGPNHIELLRLIDATAIVAFPKRLRGGAPLLLSESGRQLLTALLQKDPTKRLDADGFCEHPWIRAAAAHFEDESQKEEAFVYVSQSEKDSDSDNEEKAVELDAQSAQRSVAALFAALSHARAVCGVADLCASNCRFGCALVCYLRGAQLLRALIAKCSQLLAAIRRSAERLKTKTEAASLCSQALASVKCYVKRAQVVAGLCHDSELPFALEAANAEDVVYGVALSKARHAMADLRLAHATRSQRKALAVAGDLFDYLLTLSKVAAADTHTLTRLRALCRAQIQFMSKPI